MSPLRAAIESAEDGSHDKREAILAAAIAVIARSGVRGLKVEEVASTAGVSPALLYYHFESRSGLISATLGRAAKLAPSAAIAADRAARNGYEAVEAALLAELGAAPEVRDNAVVWGEIGATAVFEPEVRESVASAWGGWQAAVADGLRAGVEDGSVRADADPEAAADSLISLVDGLCTRWLSGAMPRERAEQLLCDRITELRRERP